MIMNADEHQGTPSIKSGSQFRRWVVPNFSKQGCGEKEASRRFKEGIKTITIFRCAVKMSNELSF